MAVYIYCPKPDDGVRSLASGLKARLITSFDGLSFWSKRDRLKIGTGDFLICWGNPIPKLDGVRMINGCDDPVNDLEAVWKLRAEGGYSTIRLERLRDIDPVKARISGYIPRSLKHSSGDDLLLLSRGKPDYWVKQCDMVNQWKCHILNKKMVRCGLSAPKPGAVLVTEFEWKPNAGLYHPWVKSDLGGWMVDYSDPKPSSAVKSFAIQVVERLGLNLCTVDLGQTPMGDLILIGVNYAPDLPDPKSVDGYVFRLERWIKGATDDGSEAKPRKKGEMAAF